MAENRIAAEALTLTVLAQASYDAVLAAAPEVYLDPRFQPDGVTLDLLAEVFRQARQAGVTVPGDFADAGDTFEYLRPRVTSARIPGMRFIRPVGPIKDRLLSHLKYLAGCLEDVNRIIALRLRIGAAREGGNSLQDLERDVAAARAAAVARGGENSVFAYAFG